MRSSLRQYKESAVLHSVIALTPKTRRGSPRPLLQRPHQQTHVLRSTRMQLLSGLRALEKQVDDSNTGSPAGLLLASDDFDTRHAGYVRTANDLLTALSSRQPNFNHAHRFDRAVVDVQRNRLFVDATYDPFGVRHQSGRKKALWDPRGKESIWAPRMKWADSRDIYDTEEVEQGRFNVDWQRAMTLPLGLGKKSMTEVELQKLKAVLWENHTMLWQLFSFYASVQMEVSYLTLNAWSQLVDECRLTDSRSEFAKRSDMDTIFIGVDTSAARASQDKRLKALSKAEYIACLLQVASAKFIRPAATSVPVSEAVEQEIAMMKRNALLSSQALAPSNAFRRSHAYTEQVNQVLRANEASLRSLFAVLARVTANGRPGATLIDLRMWILVLRLLEAIGDDFSERDAALCFLWSRMAVIDGHSTIGARKETHLPFEGFLEALCRMSVQKALPTSIEIRDAECEHAGIFLSELRLEDSSAYDTFVEERSAEWGEEPRQPLYRCIALLIDVILFTINVQLDEVDEPLGLDQKKATDWVRLKMGARVI
jgi:hypothetical protein